MNRVIASMPKTDLVEQMPAPDAAPITDTVPLPDHATVPNPIPDNRVKAADLEKRLALLK